MAPEEKLATLHVPGGAAAIEPATEPRGGLSQRQRQRQTQKQRRTQAAEELRHYKEKEKGTRSDTGGSGDKGGGKGRKGKSKLHSKGRDGKEICYSWNNKQGKCADTPPGKACPAGRAHVCQRCLSDQRRASDCPQSG